jgi:hypothetical protein
MTVCFDYKYLGELKMTIDIDELIEMASSDKVREFRSHPKKLYKYMLCGILHDIIVNGDFLSGHSYGQAKMMSISPSSWPNNEGNGYIIMKQHVITDLKSSYFYEPDRDSQVDLIIAFFRKYLDAYKGQGKTLYLVSELAPLLDIKKLVKSVKGNNLKDHHWIDITFKQPLVPTYPEFFNYIDLINLWNDFIEKYKKVKQIMEEKSNHESNPVWRELDYSYSSSLRTLIILVINFVEAYLYYYFYNCKQENKYSTNKVFSIKGFIQDTQIVEDLIFEEHDHIRDDSNIQTLYSTYIMVLKIRDRFVHTSAFVDRMNKVAELQPLCPLPLSMAVFFIVLGKFYVGTIREYYATM